MSIGHCLRRPSRGFAVVHAASAATLLVVVPAVAGAQGEMPRPRAAVGVVGGAAQFDLSGTGTTAFGGLRADYQLARFLIAEGAVGVLRPAEQYRQRFTYVIPEAQLQVQLPVGRVRPYLGVGGGALIAANRPAVYRNVTPPSESTPGSEEVIRYGSKVNATLSGAVGSRFNVSPRLDLRGELRVRGVGAKFGGALAEWTVGLARQF